MRIRFVFGVFCAVLGLVAPAGAADTKAIDCQDKVAVKTPAPLKKAKVHRSAHGRHHHRSAVMIPPPPAYMPCVLPELYAQHAVGTGVTEIAVEKKAESQYKKYVHTPGGDAPEPLHQRKGVSTWNHRS